MITVHLVFNAHIDPIWLWPWQSGLDTLLATCRNACDKLDKYPDLHFTKGEAYAYSEIERIEPELFERIKKHVEGGRWHVVNGWWLQPDCNGPGTVGFEKQIELGKEYFPKRFGFYPRVGYNVDSFGHVATLPGWMRANGQDRYVFMRPQEHEMELPGRVFRWRGYDDGPEVVAFRIAKAYTTRAITEEHIQASIEEVPEGLGHTMCFVGFGDHGGGPTEAQIAWCQENADKIDGAKLVISSPDQFFDAIWDKKDTLPEVVGELQHHSIGCYTVHRPVKVGVHRAEQMLVQADVVTQHDPAPEAGTEEKVREAWQWVCFGHFHDTFGGTCIPSAYPQVHAQLGYAQAVADEIIQHGLRRQMKALPDDKFQRIILQNASDEAYEGYAEHEPWLEHLHWQPHWRLIDEKGNPVEHQRLDPECLVPDDYLHFVRVLFPVKFAPGELKSFRIDTEGNKGKTTEYKAKVEGTTAKLSNDTGVVVELGKKPTMKFAETQAIELPRFELIEDPTDTWTHEVDRYDDTVFAQPQWDETTLLDNGPLMASVRQRGKISKSEIEIEHRVYAGEPYVEWHVQVYWSERHKLLKLTVPLAAELTERIDGIPGGELVRQQDGKERPVRDRTLLKLADGSQIGLVFPDAYALDATANKVRITLLRSPKMAHHFPYEGTGPRAVYADQGRHEFRFRFYGGKQVSGALLDNHALMLQRPLVAADLTRGMPAH